MFLTINLLIWSVLFSLFQINPLHSTDPMSHSKHPHLHTKVQMPLPHANCYWADKKLLAGEYPGCKDTAETIKKLNLYLNSGITSFIDLTTTDDPLISYEKTLSSLAQQHHLTINYKRIAIPDMDIPSSETMYKIIATIRSEIAKGHTVYVHCWGGIGRTGTVIACYFKSQGMDGEQALKKLADLWKTVKKSTHYPYSPQTQEQRQFVLNYSAQ